MTTHITIVVHGQLLLLLLSVAIFSGKRATDLTSSNPLTLDRKLQRLPFLGYTLTSQSCYTSYFLLSV